MPPLKYLINFLDKSKIKYEILEHRTVYTAMDKARTLHLEPKIVVKTAVVKFNNSYALALIPADKLLAQNKLKISVNQWRRKREPASNASPAAKTAIWLSGWRSNAGREKAVKKIDFASETWMKKNLSGKVGAAPPFGQLFKLPVFIDNILLRQSKLIVNAGDYNFSLKLTGASFKKVMGEAVKGSFAKQ
ncbi:MAG: hypothetical protein A3I88_00015 [Candidatus Portnoybacteria bacterium RIFCSPLOWO2_12_FULL_39_9]|uniref:YbaK/aminoacyl-tRNA synthetase-associated domain-containing protein n=2 Tax=Parcubacteria group TaxID=1794811 RepID=A0A1F6NJ07_9BACT|nr:MAG: hypothetical protein A2261_00635 [Candidatus Magasanikbacteria bacterium RIFOXYA2_FULL_44_8]OGZ34232.1 MAG: hypothetical protein A3H00_03265 [Candidatus Portnoybacteria bacterium RBG_13_40_8]OGZ36349.1 MAG: hypothetical protein A2646_02585 [Candidatus Portnoybacteria bacterium RIFCSPHIGHO2_02_FULL_39_12]OGZ37384.1 MAG: hypothetical protein A3J64_02185 [Candidatus Portnoybacteria bacterium RIFCSPHIGHO2_12_FULL_38_9]OGZ39197.1 MAG: hypothetical protein A3F21_03445 [Candidatus Portnoybacte